MNIADHSEFSQSSLSNSLTYNKIVIENFWIVFQRVNTSLLFESTQIQNRIPLLLN